MKTPCAVRSSIALLASLFLALTTGAFAQSPSGDVVISTNTAWAAGSYQLNSLTVNSGATLTVGGGSTLTVTAGVTVTGNSNIVLQGANTSAQVSGAWVGAGVTVNAATVEVAAGSSINADGQGYVAGAGPGGAQGGNLGGTYGGMGAGNTAAIYGSSTAPTDLGSGGSCFYCTTVGAGGGAILLTVSGTLINNGVISANGGGAIAGGAGSGGTVSITTGTLAGSGSITANGGATTGLNGGGGGRVALYFATNSGFNLALVTANGGSGQSASGAAGTVYTLGSLGANVSLTVSDDMVLPANLTLNYTSITINNQGSLTLGSGTTLTAGSISVSDAGNLTIGGGSTVNVSGTVLVTGNSNIILQGANTSAQVNGAWAGVGVTINAASVEVDAGSSINADGQGYVAGAGPGGAQGGNLGGTYGGMGAGNTAAIYGSSTAPTDLGSGGSCFYCTTVGAGGGAILLTVSGTLINNGVISANGGAANNGGAGSGGSVYVTAGSLVGAGVFTANGGGSSVTSSGGGGGRVAIYYGANNIFTGFTTSTAYGGTGSSSGTNGTVGFFDTSVANPNVNIYQQFTLPAATSYNYSNLTVQPNATLTVGGGSTINLANTLEVGGTLVLQAANNSSQVNQVWAGTGVTINAGNILVDSTGSINADEQGYKAGAGPGIGGGNLGGTYGGVGGGSSASVYGSVTAPVDLGSGGGCFYCTSVGAGGGAIRLLVTGTLTDNGTISANGGAANKGGAGSGGSIYITTSGLTGTGSIAANGGGSSNANSGGGGGRVAIDFATNSGFNAVQVTANGGTGNTAGGAGSVYLLGANTNLTVGDNTVLPGNATLAFNSITIDNQGSLTLGSGTTLTAGSLSASNGATLMVGGGSTVNVSGTLLVTGNSNVILQGANTSAQVNGVWAGAGVTLNAASVQVDAGSSINADGQGYTVGAGPGFGGGNLGGTYGGVGGGSSASVYGSSTAPVDLGSGGSCFYCTSAGAGGGAIRLLVTGMLTVNGTISANGGAANNGGAGSGGSVYIVANTISGTGTIAANGGGGSALSSGGGGRVAIYYGSNSGFSQSQISVAGGQAGTAGAAGTIVFINEIVSYWVSPTGSVLHGTKILQWFTDAGSTVNVIASGPQIFTIAAGANAYSSATWDTTTVPDGLYELRLQVLQQNESSVLAPKNVVVNNSVVWHSGRLTASQEWSASQVHALDGIVVVPSGVTLTIDPGTIVKALPGAEILVENGGILIALGGSSAPVIFTTFDDSSVGGDTDFNAGVSLPTPGEWQGIVVQTGGQFNSNAYTEILYMANTLKGTLGSSETMLSTYIYEISGTLVVPSGVVLTIQPGAIVKFDAGAGIDVQSGGQLVANGTLAQPIYFTSIKDDSVGGDTNDDGNATAPAAGDWDTILIDGAPASFNHVHFLYGGGPLDATYLLGAIQTSGNATVTIDNSTLASIFWVGLLAGGGTTTVTNSIFHDIQDRAVESTGATVHLINDTLDNNMMGVMNHNGAPMDMANSIVSNCKKGTWSACMYGAVTVVNSDVWANATGVGNYYSNDPTGSNGNISANPVFVNEAQNDFRLNYGSPAIDAGNGTVSNYPFTDAMGDTRYNDPLVTTKTGTPDANGNYSDMGALEFVQSAPSNIDLTVSEVQGPSTAMVNSTVQVSWTITNIGTGTAYGPWHDAVYLVHNPDTNPVEVYAGQFLEGAGVVLGPGASYSGSATVTVPGTVMGNHLWEVKTNVLGEIFEGKNTTNNSGQSLDLVAVDLPALTAGGAAQTGSFTAVDQSRWYKIAPGANQSVSLNLALSGSSAQTTLGSVQLFIGQGYVPTPQRYDIEQVEWNSPTASAVIANASSQTYYVTAYAQALTATPVAYALTASTVQFSLTSVSPGTVVSNSGSATLTFLGGGFSSDATFQLVGGGTVYNSSAVFVADSAHADVTFAMTNIPVGSYTAQVTLGGSTVSLANALSVTAVSTSTASQLVQVDLEAPQIFRAGFPATVTLNYSNVSGADVPAPLIWLTATGATLAEIPPDCSGCSTNFLQQYQSTFTSGLVLGIDQQGPAGVLSAGAQGRIQFQAMPTGGTVTFIVQHLDGATPDTLIGYVMERVPNPQLPGGCAVANSNVVSNGKSIRTAHPEDIPCYISAPVSTGSFANAAGFCSAFQPPFANTAGFSRTCMQLLNGAGYQWIDVTTASGNSWLLLDGAGLNKLLADDATTLSQTGTYEFNASRVMSFELNKDGFELFNQRYHQGAFGFGTSHEFDITAEVYNGVPVVHYPDGSTRSFPTVSPNQQNQFLGTPGDYGVLSVATDESWTITEKTGIAYNFIPDPQTNTTSRHLLNYIQDLNSNRITITYANGLVTSASDTFGNTIAYAYDSLGHIVQSTDPEGRITTYAYDIKSDSSHSTFLTSTTNAAGTTSISWNEGGASGVGYFSDSCVATYCEAAIGVNTITFPDGTHTYFTYDSLGRMASQYNDGSTQTVTFAYDSTGTATITDAAGNATQLAPGEYGSLAKYTDPLGAVAQISYDPEHKLTGIQGPQGANSFLNYDAQGNPAALIDPLGNQLNLSYTAYDNPLSFTDASGNATGFAYDSHYNQTGTTYPDGSAEQASYDSHGNLINWTNRRGHSISFTYDAHNLLTSKTYANGSQVSYTYDGHRNLLTATASNGTTHYSYDSADRLTGVAYPNGQAIQYTYNSLGQRASMTDSTGFTVNYAYDVAGRISQLTNASHASIVSYTYDAAGRLTRKTMGNGTYTTSAYDAAGNLLHLINYSSGGSVLSEFDYTMDAQGRRIAMNAPSGAWTYGYDADGEISSVTLPGGSVQYTYDANGNRIDAVTNGTASNYNVNNLNEYTAAGSNAYRYDADGNLTAGGGWTYNYDDENRLVAMASNTDTWAFQYDGLGNRIAATHSGTTTQFLNDPSGIGNVEAEFDGSGNLVSHYTYGLGLTSSIPASGSAAYYHFDGSGNTAQMTNASGAVVNSYSYLPFGEKISSTAGVSNPFTYVGEYGVMDEGSGLYFMRNRWYSPALGRFVQQDPAGLAGGTNLYAYTGDSPVDYVDPLGLWPSAASAYSFLPNFWGANAPVIGPEINSLAGSGLVMNSLSGGLAVVKVASLDPNSTPSQVASKGIEDTAISFAKGSVKGGVASAYITYTGGGVVTSEVVASGAMAGAVTSGGIMAAAYGGYWIGTEINQIPGVSDSFIGGWTEINQWTGGWLFNDQPQDVIVKPTAGSKDPNGKITSGFGDQGYIPAGVPITYTIFFENESTATAPAEIVTVSDPLDANLNWSTVQLSQIEFNSVTIDVPNGGQSYTGQVSVSTDSNPVKVTASLNANTGVLSWKMQSVDPTTGSLPADPMAGFLPPNNASNQGTGYVTFSVMPKTGLADGATISNTASIVFDVNAAIATNTVTNTIDNTTPISTVDSLPATTSSTSIPVSWSGSDPSGSGIASYNIYVSINGSAYSVWLPATTLTAATYTGAVGNTYSFYSIATDNVGTVQATPGTAQTITIAASTTTTYTVTPSAGTDGTISPNTAQTVNSGSATSFTVTPNSGYQIASVTGCGGTLSGNTYTTGAITANCTVSASFSALAPIASLTPSTLSFTAVSGVTSAAQTATLSNTGNAALTISGITLGGTTPGDFAQSNTCGTSLAAGLSCTISVTFTPATASSFTATLSVADDASGSPHTTALSGTGTVAPSFTVAATPASQTVQAAGMATYTVTVAAQNGAFANAVTLTASGLPTGATASFSPASVTPGSSSATSNLTIQTAAATSAASKVSPMWPLAAPALAMIGFIFVPSQRRRRWLALAVVLCASLGTLAAISGCGGSSSSKTQSYTITVTGTSGSVQQSTTVQLTVQ